MLSVIFGLSEISSSFHVRNDMCMDITKLIPASTLEMDHHHNLSSLLTSLCMKALDTTLKEKEQFIQLVG